MEILALRLTAISEAQKRSRAAFFACTAGAAIVLILVWNLSISWIRNMPDHSSAEWWDKIVFKERVKPWAQRYNYTLPLLGINMSTDDIGVIGPFALLVLTMYYASCQASIRYQVADLVNTQMTLPEVEATYISLRSGMVLNSVEEPRPATLGAEGQRGRPQTISTGGVYRTLVFLPAVAAVVAILEDFYSAFIEVAPRSPSGAVTTVFKSMSQPRDVATLILFETLGVLMALVVFKFVWQASRDTALVLEMVTKLGEGPRPEVPV